MGKKVKEKPKDVPGKFRDAVTVIKGARKNPLSLGSLSERVSALETIVFRNTDLDED